MRLKNLLSVLNTSAKNLKYHQNYSTNADIEIPKRIPRSSTDILKAISNTYQRDPTAAHYKYHDDPYLMPYSHSMKRSYALSQESGRKAAQWVRQQHADLFQHKVADPFIKAFAPKPVYDENSIVNEEILQNLIQTAQVSDAINVFNILKSKGIDVSSSTKQNLLEFLCYFNSEDPVSEDWIEERWFRMGNPFSNKNVWRPHELIEKLFNELKDADPASYSALISGMCMHGEVSKAFEMFEEARKKAIPLHVEAYNQLLGKAYLAKEQNDMIVMLIKDILAEMNYIKVKPNVRTLNGILETLSRLRRYTPGKKVSLQFLAEFKSLGIEPSLASYLLLIEIFSKDKAKLIGLIYEILKDLQQRTLTIQDPKDILFFVRAMEVCSQFKNTELGYLLHDILLKDNNYNFIGDSMKESVYYRNYFFLLVNTEPLSKVMEVYDKLVPGVYIPEPAVTNSILNAVHQNMAWDLIPRLWTDIVLFEQSMMSGVLENTLLSTAANTDDSLNEQMSNIAWKIWEIVEGDKRERLTLQWTASMLGNLILSLLKGGEKAKAHLVMDKLIRLGSTIMNEPPIEAMRMYVDSCIQDNTPELAIKVTKYCDEIGFVETTELAQHLNSSLELTDTQREKLATIVGADCLKKSPSSKGIA